MTTKAEREAQAREAEAAEETAAGATAPEGASLGEARFYTLPEDAYPARPYTEALTDEHKAVLEQAGQLPE